MTPPHSTSFFVVLWHARWLILTTVVLGAMAAAVFSWLLPPSETAQTRLVAVSEERVRQMMPRAFPDSDIVAAESQGERLTRERVFDALEQRLHEPLSVPGYTGEEPLAERVTVRRVEEPIERIEVRLTGPTEAEALEWLEQALAQVDESVTAGLQADFQVRRDAMVQTLQSELDRVLMETRLEREQRIQHREDEQARVQSVLDSGALAEQPLPSLMLRLIGADQQQDTLPAYLLGENALTARTHWLDRHLSHLADEQRIPAYTEHAPALRSELKRLEAFPLAIDEHSALRLAQPPRIDAAARVPNVPLLLVLGLVVGGLAGVLGALLMHSVRSPSAQ